jgi:hypothetical protein
MRRVFAVIAAAISAFWVFYTARLLVVTHMLSSLRSGGRGAYAGAVVFPVLAVLFGWLAWRLWRPRAASVRAVV